MQKVILQLVKATFLMTTIFSTASVYSQQFVIADKDNTHPEQTAQQYTAARITSFSVVHQNSYNEIQWTARNEQDTRRYIVECSADGTHYSTAGELMPTTGEYNLEHRTTDGRSLLYRIRIEKNDGRYINSADFLLEGINVPPVKVYPNIVRNNLVNVHMYLPVQRISLFSPDGRHVFARDMTGFSGDTPIVFPSTLNSGIYYMTFYGNGWKTSATILVTHP